MLRAQNKKKRGHNNHQKHDNATPVMPAAPFGTTGTQYNVVRLDSDSHSLILIYMPNGVGVQIGVTFMVNGFNPESKASPKRVQMSPNVAHTYGKLNPPRVQSESK